MPINAELTTTSVVALIGRHDFVARNRYGCYPGATRVRCENGLPEGKPLICLVAGTGFEPVTFGL